MLVARKILGGSADKTGDGDDLASDIADNRFDDPPSEDDFRNHCSLMKQFARKVPVLAKSGEACSETYVLGCSATQRRVSFL